MPTRCVELCCSALISLSVAVITTDILVRRSGNPLRYGNSIWDGSILGGSTVPGGTTEDDTLALGVTNADDALVCGHTAMEVKRIGKNLQSISRNVKRLDGMLTRNETLPHDTLLKQINQWMRFCHNGHALLALCVSQAEGEALLGISRESLKVLHRSLWRLYAMAKKVGERTQTVRPKL